MLEEMATVGDESIVSWQSHGKAFRVHQPSKFASTVMPRYFKQQTKYKSFQRQLHLYGFHRIGTGMDRGAYFHSMFIRNQKSLSLRMTCQKIKGKKSSDAAYHRDAPVDPDFYSSATNVAIDQGHDRRNLTNALQSSDPILHNTSSTITKESKRACNQRGRATLFSTGSCDHNADEDRPLRRSSLLNEEVPGAGARPSPAYQLIGWMENAQTVMSCEEHIPPYNAYGSSAPLLGVNHQKQENEGFFEGRRFFHVAETKTPTTMTAVCNAVAGRGGPMRYISSSA